MKILIVDDRAPDRAILRYTFESHQCETIEAENGQQGLSLAAEYQPDLIISDALMPVMDGYGFLRALKTDESLRDIPFIFYSAVYTGFNEEKLARALGAEAFLVKPLEPEVLWQEVQTLMDRCNTSDVVAMFTTASEDTAFLKDYSQVVATKLEEKVAELEELFFQLIRVLISLQDAKSPWTMGHSERVAEIAVRIAQGLGLDETRVDSIRLGALLHDIGKIGTDDNVIDKRSALTEEEYALVKSHPERGADALMSIQQLKEIVPAIRYHHENFDGSGYPAHLKQNAIPLAAKILRVADSFDSMISSRPYRSSPGMSYALAELKRCAGSDFDPEVVKTFINVLTHEPFIGLGQSEGV